jgi:hypothetical protein
MNKKFCLSSKKSSLYLSLAIVENEYEYFFCWGLCTPGPSAVWRVRLRRTAVSMIPNSHTVSFKICFF